jgi:U3 small nucleolar RNA-associated protein 11
MRNAIPRRSHRERPQPYARQKRGLLEKNKDYVLRSQDYKRKQAKVKRLSEIASERNPDEFYFSMVRKRTENGVPIVDRPESRPMSVKQVKPLKMQDAAYLRTVRNIERKKIEKLQSLVPLASTGGNKGKNLFADDEEEGALSYSL